MIDAPTRRHIRKPIRKRPAPDVGAPGETVLRRRAMGGAYSKSRGMHLPSRDGRRPGIGGKPTLRKPIRKRPAPGVGAPGVGAPGTPVSRRKRMPAPGVGAPGTPVSRRRRRMPAPGVGAPGRKGGTPPVTDKFAPMKRR